MPVHPAAAADYFTGPALTVALACEHDDEAALDQALAVTQVSPDAVGEKGMSLLMLALRNRSKKAMLALLRHGANPNLETKLSLRQVPVQPVAMAAGGGDSELLAILLDHGGDPNSRSDNEPAIFEAIMHDRYDQMRLLLDHGADVNVTNKDGTPLINYLTGLAQLEQTAYLIERGADIHKMDTRGGTVAFELQDRGFGYQPTDYLYPWMVKAKHLLEARGVRFPVADPYLTHRAQVRGENAQRRQWEATAEGRRFIEPIRAAERAREQLQDPALNHNRAQQLRLQAEVAFQAWRKTQPGWVPIVPLLGGEHYPDALTPAQEAADAAEDRDRAQADSTRWAEQLKALP